MSKNPLLNGLVSSAYIFVLVLFLDYGMRTSRVSETFVVPVIMISVFTFSAAVMSYLFVYQPLQLYFDGKKKEAITLFLQTTAVFGTITLTIALLFFSGLIK